MEGIHFVAGMLDHKVAPPEGSFTEMDYAERFGLARSTARNRLQSLVGSGLLSVVPIGPRKTLYYTVKQ